MSAVNPSRLSGLKAAQLKYIAFLTGLNTTGTKAELEVLIKSRLSAAPVPQKAQRILSVDMGIRNLAFCLLEKPRNTSLPDGTNIDNATVSVQAWKRVDVLGQLVHDLKGFSALEADDGPLPAARKRRKKAESLPEPETQMARPSKARKQKIPADAFTPSSLSKVAYDIAAEFIAYEPCTILIERQRFRSGGAPMIQEWTVRVNMLESMLHACFETLRRCRATDGSPFPDVFEVSPKRVGSFWTAGYGVPLTMPEDWDVDENVAKIIGGKVEKKDKVAVARSWINDHESVSLSFSEDVQETVQSFQQAKKLDDLADCLLQGMAWIRWQENRFQLSKLLQRQPTTLT